MKRMTFTAETSANGQITHSLGTPGDTAWVNIKSLIISTRAGLVGKDVSIKIYDGSSLRWEAILRDTKEWKKDFFEIGMIKMEGAFTIEISKPAHNVTGTGVIVVASCVYNCYTADEETQL